MSMGLLEPKMIEMIQNDSIDESILAPSFLIREALDI